MPFSDILDELTEAIWPSVERSVQRHGSEATSEALVTILGRVLALRRQAPDVVEGSGPI